MQELVLFSIRFNLIDLDEAANLIAGKITQKKSSYVCLIGAHPAVEARLKKEYAEIINKAALILPDGMSVVWAARLLGHKIKDRIYGPDLMLKLLAISEKKGYNNFFYGSTKETLRKLVKNLKDRFPHLNIVGTLSPPFRELSNDEEDSIIKRINKAKPDILWVALGAPKQDIWMSLHKDKLSGVTQIGVGAAFDFHAGAVRQAPNWVQRHGLEWFYRITQEPGRLWLRYAKCVPLFMIFALMQYMRIGGKNNAEK